MSRTILEITVLWVFLCECIADCPNSIDIRVAYSSKSCSYRFQAKSTGCDFVECLYKQSTTSTSELHGWSQCFMECCSSANLLPSSDTLGLLYDCQSFHAQKSNLLTGLIIGFLALFLILLIVLVVCLNKKECFLFKLRKSSPGQNYEHALQNVVSLKNINRKLFDLTNGDLDGDRKEATEADIFPCEESRKYEWSSGKKNMRLLQSKCGICLDIRPNCELSCGHFFHAKCLGMWFDRGKSIGPCGDDGIKLVRSYCSECLKYISYNSVHKFKSRLRSNHPFLCLACKSTQKSQ